MADQPPQTPPKHEESATTREEPDFDDNEHEQATGTVSPLGHESPLPSTAAHTTTTPAARKSVSFQRQDETPPTKPPRPLSPNQQAENTLIEAFPTIDTKIVKAVLVASGGQVEPAFNALLGMSDPSFSPETPRTEERPPAQPPRPTANRVPMTQMEADEMYARQLAEQFNSPASGAPRGGTGYNRREPGARAPNAQPPRRGDGGGTYQEENERNFFDDELPEIGRNIQQGFMETQKKVNSWFTNFKKRIDGEDEDGEEDLYSSDRYQRRPQQSQYPNAAASSTGMGRQNFGPSQSDQLRGIQKMSSSSSTNNRRQSTEATTYDADPHELQPSEFDRLELRDTTEDAPPMPPRVSSRQAPNPNLFKSTSTTASSPTPKSLPRAPQAGFVDEVEAAGESTDPKARKWRPLTAVAPAPAEEEGDDPFSLGDDDEGQLEREREKSEDLRKEDSERLKAAARGSVGSADAAAGGSGSGSGGKVLGESERSGSLNAEMVDLLAGEKKG